MAKSSINGAMPFACKLHVQGVQSVIPTKPTDPRQSIKILVPQNNLSSTSSILQRRFHILLCYNKASDDDSGWVVAGRIKESLGLALQEQPLLAGRLRPCEESDTDLQIVSNDSGVRLVEAKADMNLTDFVELKEKREAEAELVFWEDVAEHNVQFSPLFYVQVTNFNCGGYSIGISCSLLLVDPFELTSFLKRWAKIHNNTVSKTDVPKIPTFYLPNLGKRGSPPALLMGSNTGNNAAESVIFNIPTKILNLNNNVHNNLASVCIEEAERDVGRKLASSLSLFLKVPYEDAKVEICSRQGLIESPSGYNVNGLSCARTWDELGLNSVCFSEGNKPVHVSCWINSVIDQGFVMIVPSSDANTSGVNIVVTFT